MKKIFLFAAAAMVSLSSCVQTSEIYTGKLQEMGFKSAVTRGIIQTNDDMTYPISVTAVWDDAQDGNYSSYFENGKFVYDAGTELWKGEPARYWPTSGDMQFIGLCPYPANSSITPSYKTNGEIEKVVWGTIDNNLMDQHDVVFSDLLSVEAPQTSAQPLLFHHAYAQLNVTFKKTDSAAAVIVKNVSVKDVNLSGILTVTPVVGAKSEATWQAGLPISRYFLPETTTGVENGTLDATLEAATPFAPQPVLVIPAAQTKIVIVYTIDGHEHTYTHTLSGNWEMGYKYTYNYTINVNEIIFDCTVEDWIPVDGGNITI
ncbi:MAG: fimbrillin family protein [Alistipes sp.]|nr:fimbrillin family protein [Alistipes sp.]MBR2866926.1 fimbrillin family protein [Alistipes sp.]